MVTTEALTEVVVIVDTLVTVTVDVLVDVRPAGLEPLSQFILETCQNLRGEEVGILVADGIPCDGLGQAHDSRVEQHNTAIRRRGRRAICHLPPPA